MRYEGIAERPRIKYEASAIVKDNQASLTTKNYHINLYKEFYSLVLTSIDDQLNRTELLIDH